MHERKFLVGLAVGLILCAAVATIYTMTKEPDPFASDPFTIDRSSFEDFGMDAEHEIDIDIQDEEVVITLAIDTDNLSDLDVSATGSKIDISANVKRESGNSSFTYRMQHAQTLPVSVDPDSLKVRQERRRVVISMARAQ